MDESELYYNLYIHFTMYADLFKFGLYHKVNLISARESSISTRSLFCKTFDILAELMSCSSPTLFTKPFVSIRKLIIRISICNLYASLHTHLFINKLL